MILLPPALYGITARRAWKVKERRIGQTGFVKPLGGVALNLIFVSRNLS